MSKESVLRQVEEDIERGDLGKARDRLHGLIANYPDDITLRAMLGVVYSKLQFLQMAGRYWYLEEDKTESMKKAVAAFEEALGNDARQILMALKFRGEIREIPEYARNRLVTLQEESSRRWGDYPEYGCKGKLKWKQSNRARVADRLIFVGCIAVLVLSAVLATIGIVTVVRWLR